MQKRKRKWFQKPAELNTPETLTKEKVRARAFGATRRERAREKEREREGSARERKCTRRHCGFCWFVEVVVEWEWELSCSSSDKYCTIFISNWFFGKKNSSIFLFCQFLSHIFPPVSRIYLLLCRKKKSAKEIELGVSPRFFLPFTGMWVFLPFTKPFHTAILWVFFSFIFPLFSQLSFLLVFLKNCILESCCTTVSAFFSLPRPHPGCFGLCLLRHESFRGRRFEHFLCIEIGDGSSWLHHVLRSLSFPYGLACLWRKKNARLSS